MNGASATPTKKDLRVAVVGGGICGLICAVGLTKAGVNVHLYEAAPKFGEVGAGVGLGPNAIHVLKELELLDKVVAKSDLPKPEIRPCHFVSGYGDHEVIYDYPVKPEDVGLGIHRVAFLDAIAPMADPARTHFNKRCVSLSESSDGSEVVIHFADGTTASADIALGADGVRSVVRTYVVEGVEGYTSPGRFVHASFTNSLVYRGLVPTAKLVEVGVRTVMNKTVVSWNGLDKHIVTFPIKGGTIINIAAFVTDRSKPPSLEPLPQPWVTQHSTEEVLSEFADWGPDVRAFLGCLENPSAWAVHSVNPLLDSYSRGRVAVLGDAAHAMLPHLGAGAGQSLEDALLLIRLLSHSETKSTNVELVLQAYDMMRRPRGNHILESSIKSGLIYEGHGPSGGSIQGQQKDLPGIWNIWYHDQSADFANAVRWLLEKKAFT
ncbi:FAD/NAD-P-binding domain-containing protein [Schizopora paradoxa]|uniref:FAD/NAD-P-binding domain-containing protein n=1 Tax=Schizopora paradoxa TaxID=27342 RepID=A0A0H2RKT6_9AGAM|nr:FAD/NAD-P-binding domain-containing protein [Schizopora paradoxa]